MADTSNIGTENVPKDTKSQPMGDQNTSKHKDKKVSITSANGGGEGGRTWICAILLAPLGRFRVSILAPTESRRVDPLGVSRCICLVLHKNAENK